MRVPIMQLGTANNLYRRTRRSVLFQVPDDGNVKTAVRITNRATRAIFALSCTSGSVDWCGFGLHNYSDSTNVFGVWVAIIVMPAQIIFVCFSLILSFMDIRAFIRCTWSWAKPLRWVVFIVTQLIREKGCHIQRITGARWTKAKMRLKMFPVLEAENILNDFAFVDTAWNSFKSNF